MKEDVSVQLITHTSDNILKLFDLSTRIDERVKSHHVKQCDMEGRLEEIIKRYASLMERVAIAEFKLSAPIEEEIELLRNAINDMDRRMISLEQTSRGNENRWNIILQFAVQLAWIILAAYVLYRLNLSPPPTP